MRSAPLVSNFQLATPCKRLWLCAGALAVFLLTLLIGNHFSAIDKSVTREMLGHDFLAFYTAGSFVLDGHARDLYNLDLVRDFEQRVAHQAGLEVGKSFGPWWNPPFYALVFEPLALMPYARALDVWRCISFGAVIIALILLSSIVMRPSIAVRWEHGLLVPLCVAVSMPFIQAMSHGQNTFISLLVLTITVMLWRAERKFLAGVVCGLLFYKPQLGAVVAAAMVIDLGPVALGGLTVTGFFLLGTTLAILPGSLQDWVQQLPANVRSMQIEHAYLWERHVTLKSFWRLLLQGREAGEPMLVTTLLTWASVALVGGGLVWSMLQRWMSSVQSGSPLHRDRLIAATITAMPLLMPFYFDYDLLLLAVPITLYAAERVSHPHHAASADKWFIGSWVALFFWLFINPAFALHTHISGTVILLASTFTLSVRRMNCHRINNRVTARPQSYQLVAAA